MITFTRYFLKRAKECKFIPFAEFTAMARGKEGRLFDFFLSIKDTKLVEFADNGLKIIATDEQLNDFKREVYKRFPPFKDFKKVSVFDINRKAKKFTALAYKILDYIKRNPGCDLKELQGVFNTPDFREAHSLLVNDEFIACVEGEFFVTYADKDYQMLVNNIKGLGFTLDDEQENEKPERVGGKPCSIKIGEHTFSTTYFPDDTPEKIIYDYYMKCSDPQIKMFLRGKKAYLLTYPNLIDKERSYFKATAEPLTFNLHYGVKLCDQIRESFLCCKYDVEADFVIKTFGV